MLLIPMTTTLLGKAHNKKKKVTKVYMNCRALYRYKELNHLLFCSMVSTARPI